MSLFRRRLMIANALKKSSGINYPGLIAAWSAKGKTNDDEDRAILKDLTGNGHDITLNGFAFSEMSGYGGYSTDFTKWSDNQTVVKFAKTNTVINITEFITGAGISFAVNNDFKGTIKFKINGLTDEIDLRCKTTAEDGTQTQNKLSNGEYNFDNYGYISFICLNGFKGKCDITIELLPEYPDALVFDGVDDYGINENMPILTDYTVIAKLKTPELITNGGAISKRDARNGQNKESFVLLKNNQYSRSFGTATKVTIPNGINVLYQTATNFNNQIIQKGETIDTNTLILGAGIINSISVAEFVDTVFYSAYLFDRSLDEQEIKEFIRKYIDPEYLLPSERPQYITFADTEVERICVENWSSDGIGLTVDDAEKITTIKNYFQNNNLIHSFEEFKYFINVKNIIDYMALSGMSSLEKIALPTNLEVLGEATFLNNTLMDIAGGIPKTLKNISYPNCFKNTGIKGIIDLPNLSNTLPSNTFKDCPGITEIKSLGSINRIDGSAFENCQNLVKAEIPDTSNFLNYNVFKNCVNLKTVIIKAITAPVMAENNVFANTHSDLSIYVPDESVETYKTATNWINYADKIHPLSEYVEE